MFQTTDPFAGNVSDRSFFMKSECCLMQRDLLSSFNRAIAIRDTVFKMVSSKRVTDTAQKLSEAVSLMRFTKNNLSPTWLCWMNSNVGQRLLLDSKRKRYRNWSF